MFKRVCCFCCECLLQLRVTSERGVGFFGQKPKLFFSCALSIVLFKTCRFRIADNFKLLNLFKTELDKTAFWLATSFLKILLQFSSLVMSPVSPLIEIKNSLPIPTSFFPHQHCFFLSPSIFHRHHLLFYPLFYKKKGPKQCPYKYI